MQAICDCILILNFVYRPIFITEKKKNKPKDPHKTLILLYNTVMFIAVGWIILDYLSTDVEEAAVQGAESLAHS